MGIDTTRMCGYGCDMTNEELERLLQTLRDQGRLDPEWYRM